MKRALSKEVEQNGGKAVTMFGWVDARRDHGKIIFIDLRDRWGVTQIVFDEKNYKDASKLGQEDVIKVTGEVKSRPEGLQNPKIVSGKVEVQAENLEILAKSKTPPFGISDTKKVSEDTRMKYRYLDLRSERMKNNLIMRHKVVKFIRDYLSAKDFIEIETPDLTKATPEGARDYLVPARLHPGKFYALPQSPQQFKQLLMVAGIEKYFQIARCFRDEDPRGDRQPEFTQLDLEMSFVEQKDILDLYEELLIEMMKKLFPEKRISQVPFPRLKYNEVMAKYKTDKPDLRKNKDDKDELAFCWIIDWPMFSWNEKEKRWDPHHHIFTSPHKEDIGLLDKDPAKVRSWQQDLVLNGFEIAGGSIRITDPQVQEKVLELVGISKEIAKERFGHMLEAFEFGVPPHGGIAPGIDRFCMILANEESIREVIAFPKTGDGRDLMMDAPANIDDEQLQELKIKISK
ncbi:hypothetical protein A2V71_00630 [Candidatus Berkelbacteria bacterium RBG_13_40_8]|uniref:Aspartate--tRNA(Asp/Asn) ligase n=1 Tax=Candidatus Berkelbacteria bacterium RBG_13_40_8 TaxID=1797467 RepID=A0A1F5DQ79_9BACT|nr:MAG: hypothetical protein A2V71_00630 [Candidatus Berkelbacteria bacterium RBG_13_40_8]